jgi:hypothetical protein
VKIGTRSLLFGFHQVAIHPYFVARAWRIMYGPPRDLRLWLAFIVHDWGYWGLSNMQGPEGELHPELGARIMSALFGKEWGDFCRGHSRWYSRRTGAPLSKLCPADKLATPLYPAALFWLLYRFSGELWEYVQLAIETDFIANPRQNADKWAWQIRRHFTNEAWRIWRELEEQEREEVVVLARHPFPHAS